MKRTRLVLLLTLISVSFTLISESGAREIAPLHVEKAVSTSDVDRGVFSKRSLTLTVRVDRDSAHLVAFTVKPRPFVAPIVPPAPRPYEASSPLQLEIVLLGDNGIRHTQRIDVGPVCLLHDGDTKPHSIGDTVFLHRDSVVVNAPEVARLDRVEFAYYRYDEGGTTREVIGEYQLDSAKFRLAGGKLTYNDLAFSKLTASKTPSSRLAPGAGTEVMTLPLDCAEPFDPPLAPYVVLHGVEAEADRRINVVIVGDGYQCDAAADLRSDARALVDYLTVTTPYSDYNEFINYYLVYAFSVNDGPDECYSGHISNTAFGTYYKNEGISPWHGAGGCDADYELSNLDVAKSIAPFADDTVIMINYGGYYAQSGRSSSTLAVFAKQQNNLARHELGHLLGHLGDEYTGDDVCPPNPHDPGSPNYSVDPLVGKWPEWVESPYGTCSEGCIGTAEAGGGGYELGCFYHPTNNCRMLSKTSTVFCPVCRQAWSQEMYGHPRIAPTAPLKSATFLMDYDGIDQGPNGRPDGDPYDDPMSSPVLIAPPLLPCGKFEVETETWGQPVTVDSMTIFPNGAGTGFWPWHGSIPFCFAENGHFTKVFAVTAEPDLVKKEYPEYWESIWPSNRDYGVFEICIGDPATDWCECISLPPNWDCPGTCTVSSNCTTAWDTGIQCGTLNTGGTFGCPDGPGEEDTTVHVGECECEGESGGPGSCSNATDRVYSCQVGGISPGI